MENIFRTTEAVEKTPEMHTAMSNSEAQRLQIIFKNEKETIKKVWDSEYTSERHSDHIKCYL